MLAEALTKEGWEIFWDRKVEPGEHWNVAIEKALAEAGCVVVLWSNQSVAKRWVKLEAGNGLARGVLIPVRIEQVQEPLEFSDIQSADLADWQGERLHAGLLQLRERIAHVLGARPPGSDALIGIREDDLRATRPDAPIEDERLRDVVFRLESGKQPFTTGFSLGKSSLLVADANLYHAIAHYQRFRWQERIEIQACPLSGAAERDAVLVLPPVEAQDFVLFDLSPWVGPATIRIGGEAAAAGDDAICVVAAGPGTGMHAGKVVAVDASTTVAGTPRGPVRMHGLIRTDIKTEPGSAGAPLLRKDGTLLGMIVAGYQESSLALPVQRLWRRLVDAGIVRSKDPNG